MNEKESLNEILNIEKCQYCKKFPGDGHNCTEFDPGNIVLYLENGDCEPCPNFKFDFGKYIRSIFKSPKVTTVSAEISP